MAIRLHRIIEISVVVMRLPQITNIDSCDSQIYICNIFHLAFQQRDLVF